MDLLWQHKDSKLMTHFIPPSSSAYCSPIAIPLKLIPSVMNNLLILMYLIFCRKTAKRPISRFWKGLLLCVFELDFSSDITLKPTNNLCMVCFLCVVIVLCLEMYHLLFSCQEMETEEKL